MPLQSATLWLLLAPYSRGVIVPTSGLPPPWNPFSAFGAQPRMASAIVAARVLGGATVLPVMEEVGTHKPTATGRPSQGHSCTWIGTGATCSELPDAHRRGDSATLTDRLLVCLHLLVCRAALYWCTTRGGTVVLPFPATGRCTHACASLLTPAPWKHLWAWSLRCYLIPHCASLWCRAIHCCVRCRS